MKISRHVNGINRFFLRMVNRERRIRRLPPVMHAGYLEQHAIRWSRHMADIRTLCHSGDILENACMVPARGSPYAIAVSMFRRWKESPPHWLWMMDPDICRAGFGFTVRGEYAYGAFAFNTPHEYEKVHEDGKTFDNYQEYRRYKDVSNGG